MSSSERAREIEYDVVVIGAGVVGCAIARRMTLDGARTAVIERAADILDGASKGNSAILHTGFDAPPDSLELRCIQDGHAEYLDIHERLGLPLIRCGALVLAWNEAEEERLDALM
ncbi:MAG: FAD-dependent oxidoreductase, partial [Geminicoccaceae bacterium]|nr:FAD-dependent oxidoreductase [Geminicoccaceae bacterium]